MRWCGWILAGLMVTAASAEHQVHVAAAAAPGGDGTRLAPYRTLAQARDGIRSARRDGALAIGVPVTVHVGPGVYRLEETFLLTAEDGGSATAPIAYRATEPGTVHLHGGATLEPESFRPVTDREVLARLDPAVRGKVLERDVTDVAGGGFAEFTVDQRVPSGPWLYAGRSPMTLARWPNADAPDAGWASFSAAVDKGLPMAEAEDPALRQPRPGSFVLDDPRPARWRLDDGVWLLGYWTHDWCEEAIRIASYDPHGKVIALAAPHAYGIMAGTWGQARRRFFAFNALEELDAPDEWLLDRRRNRLYIHADMLARPAPMVLSTLAQPLLKVDGARHLKFIGLTFGYAHADSIVLAHTEDIEMAGCTVANGAGHGIVVNGIGNTVRSCDLFNLGRGGIRLHGGDRRTLTPAGNLAINNHIQRFGLFQRTYAPGIGVEGCGQIVRHNRIHDAPHNAVLYGGNEHLFELNEVYRVVMETGDAGAFYTGRDWTSQGNILRHNFIHDLGGGDPGHVNTMGIYLDDCDAGDAIIGNVFLRAGRAIMIGGGRDNPVLNNLAVDCPIGLHLDARGMTWTQWNTPNDGWHLEEKANRLAYTRPPWSTRYPRLAAIMAEDPRQPLGNPIRRNVFVDCARRVCDLDDNVRGLLDKLEIADNLAVSTDGTATLPDLKGFLCLSGTPERPVDLGFVDRKEDNLALRPDAPLLKALPAFETIPFEKIGLFTDEHRRTLP